jgi:hypothetical protein
MNMMWKARLFSHEGIQYVVTWNSERFEVYGSDVLDCLQVLVITYTVSQEPLFGYSDCHTNSTR